MTVARDRRADRGPVVALVLASVLLVGSVALAVSGALGPAPWRSVSSSGGGYGRTMGGYGGTSGYGGMMGGRSDAPMGGGGYGGMMGGRIWLAGDGQAVTTIAQARARAAAAGQPLDLHPGEVMQFTNNFYVELKDASDRATTEVLVDLASGAVQTEPGPAMMWNTGTRTATLAQAQAIKTAADWLAANRPGETVKTIDAYPGYYTVDTEAGGKVAGMLSVNATTGAVWYHTWHGRFIAMEDA